MRALVVVAAIVGGTLAAAIFLGFAWVIHHYTGVDLALALGLLVAGEAGATRVADQLNKDLGL